MEKIKVDIIDDNKLVREGLVKLIQDSGEFEVAGAYDSSIAFLNDPFIGNREPSILLLDIGRSRTLGLNTIPSILERVPQIRIVVFTIYEEEDVVLKALCSGACCYLSKKADLDDILAAIRNVAIGKPHISSVIASKIAKDLIKQNNKNPILSKRKKEILQRLAYGKSYQMIANELLVSVETIKSHTKQIYKTLEVRNKTEAIALYLCGHIR